MINCPRCGHRNLDGHIFCLNCGCKLIQQENTTYSKNKPMLKTNRGLAKYFFLSILTFGIYGLVVMSSISRNINVIATKHDGKKTHHYLLMSWVFTPLTLGISQLTWYTKISNRIGKDLDRREINYSFGAGSFWGWCILGSLIFVGPFIYFHKLFKAMNLLSKDYNIRD